eukprot:gnl/Spiro4/29736_TR14605_c0_g1_i1.p1 gnl/Spiro4/29736_TR14605_c0_g1~~gnl/Spiro4/29736_TR14605_c0_g1_i1.p1  ORF type:complete len:199 (+),score=38.58 gnl/Spiro4/29736_TR14605_c0_g1_i1:41-598(+)
MVAVRFAFLAFLVSAAFALQCSEDCGSDATCTYVDEYKAPRCVLNDFGQYGTCAEGQDAYSSCGDYAAPYCARIGTQEYDDYSCVVGAPPAMYTCGAASEDPSNLCPPDSVCAAVPSYGNQRKCVLTKGFGSCEDDGGSCGQPGLTCAKVGRKNKCVIAMPPVPEARHETFMEHVVSLFRSLFGQ